MTTTPRWRPKKLRPYDKLTKVEKETIYYNYTNWWSELSLWDFARQERLAPIDMSKLLRVYEVATWEDLNNELNRILKADSDIVLKSQGYIREYLDGLADSRKKVGIKEIETILKAADNALKRTTIINKVIEDKKEGNKWTPMEIKLSL